MKSYSYKNGILGAETARGWSALSDTLTTAQRPVYVYNTHSIDRRVSALKAALAGVDSQIHFAMKSNSNPEILRRMKAAGLGVDVVSAGEAQLALDCGFKGKDIIFSGVAKSKAEIIFALKNGFFQINVESLPELERIGRLSQELGSTAPVGIRINPDIMVDTHPYITTGFRENKFGIAEEQISDVVAILKKYPEHLSLRGLSCHLGSQIRDLKPIGNSLKSLIAASENLIAQGFDIQTLDIGGGVGIDYGTDDESSEYAMMAAFGEMIKSTPLPFKARLLLEPGRWLVARSGVLCSQVEYVKFNGSKNFLILNTGMNHLMRPALYRAAHRSLLLKKTAAPEKIFDLVGPICESSDTLGFDRVLPEPQEGDWIALMDAGAYGMSMANSYNRHEFPLEILI